MNIYLSISWSNIEGEQVGLFLNSCGPTGRRSTELEVGFAPEPVRTFQRIEKSLAAAGVRKQNIPARSIVSIPSIKSVSAIILLHIICSKLTEWRKEKNVSSCVSS